MGMFQSSHKQTKKSYLINAIIAFLLGLFMIACIFIDPNANPRDFIVSACIVWLMGAYWLYKRHRFDDKEFNDPFKIRRDN